MLSKTKRRLGGLHGGMPPMASLNRHRSASQSVAARGPELLVRRKDETKHRNNYSLVLDRAWLFCELDVTREA
jgi:hypothetical protein